MDSGQTDLPILPRHLSVSVPPSGLPPITPVSEDTLPGRLSLCLSLFLSVSLSLYPLTPPSPVLHFPMATLMSPSTA